MSLRSACLGVGLAAACSLSLGGQTPPTTITLLDRYAAGQFAAVVADLDALDNFEPLLKDLKNHAGEWMAAGGTSDLARRELAAATFALEAARVDAWREWKWIQEPPQGTLPTLYWKPPPLLIEWACELFRRDVAPRPIERTWQLAAMAVAQRSEDPQFLIGFTQAMDGGAAATAVALGVAPETRSPASARVRALIAAAKSRESEVLNKQDEIGHLNHTMDRFPADMRFLLGQGVARERDFPGDAEQIYTALADDPDVGAEALTRLGGLLVRQDRLPVALAALDRAERLTRDSYLLYLARLFRGHAMARARRGADAESAFRGALAARPAMESASIPLAEMLFRSGRRTEAQSLMVAVLAADPAVRDPYLELVHGDDRFWPQLIARLRREIKP